MRTQNQNGKVYIVGAGPGDPGLMTVKGLDKLKQADVVVYDRLINDDLLSYCKESCEKIFVGKESGYHPIEQEQITEIMIRKSRLGLTVVRLKGGNPFVFGRGSEEGIALKDAGIDFEIIPGITSGLSAPIYSGIPITHRGLITQCILITAHESPGKQGTQVEWDKLARLKNATLIIYMGASRIESICNELVDCGMDPSTPSAVIENGTLPKQRTITGRLDRIAQEFKTMDFHAPAIIIISPTVAMRDQLSWFENKPLFAKRIVISGGRKQLDYLRGMVYDLGGEVLPLPFSDSTSFPDSPGGNGHDRNDGRSVERNSLPYGFQYDESNESDFPLMSRKTAFTTVSAESMDDLAGEIRNRGADAFIFTTSSAVEYFFDILGYETAVNLLEHGKSIALNRAAADTLVNKDVRNINVCTVDTIEGFRDFITNLFSVT